MSQWDGLPENARDHPPLPRLRRDRPVPGYNRLSAADYQLLALPFTAGARELDAALPLAQTWVWASHVV
jgi:hypothetical protein